MSRSHRAAGALSALVLVACAHGGSAPTRHVPAGQAAQPQSWNTTWSSESESPQVATGAPGMGGRAAQPFGWPENLAEASGPSENPPAAAYQGGRAGQPFGWPEHRVRDPRQNAAASCDTPTRRNTVARSRFSSPDC
jgi:hypothetical protein